jgi:type III secretion protein S
VIASVIALLREGLLLALLLAAPVLVAAVIAGVLSGLVAAFTQIQDPAVSVALRVIGVGLALVLFAPAIGAQLVAFAHRIWPLMTAVSSSS